VRERVDQVVKEARIRCEETVKIERRAIGRIGRRMRGSMNGLESVEYRVRPAGAVSMRCARHRSVT